MGGNIQFFTKTRRYDKSEYEELELDITEKLYCNIFKDEVYSTKYEDNIEPIAYIKDKLSFGDCDIVINSKYLLHNYIEIIVKIFRLKVGDWVKNGNVLSIAYKNFQVDLIITPNDDYRSSLNYFAFSDCSMIIGKMMRAYYGIRFGHSGLHLVIQDEFNKLGEILLTKDIKIIHELLALNHSKWLDGFYTLEDMFYWVCSSPYFNKEVFSYESMNSTDRIRERKRTTYGKFLEYSETRNHLPSYEYKDYSLKYGYSIKQPQFDNIIVPMFPHVLEEYNKIMDKFHSNNLFKEKFNGKIINELMGLSDKELGHFISYAKEQIELTHTRDMFIKHTQHTCNQIILSLYTHYINGWETWLNVPEELVTNFIRG